MEQDFDVDMSDFLSDQRVSPRVDLFTRVELPWHSSKAVRARDISLSGMRALSRDGRVAHCAGERVHLRFRLPNDAETIEATARVVSQRASGNDVCVGFRFESLTPHAAVRIYRFISRRQAP